MLGRGGWGGVGGGGVGDEELLRETPPTQRRKGKGRIVGGGDCEWEYEVN